MLCLFNICFIYTAPQASSFKHKPCINKVALPLPFFFGLGLLNDLTYQTVQKVVVLTGLFRCIGSLLTRLSYLAAGITWILHQ